jgi:16S rRNA (uracil1498-N3)-methyltransferase
MTRRRWIADEFSDNHAALTGEHASHLSRTLRVRVGQEFDVACGSIVRRATVSSVSVDRVEFTLGEELLATAVVPVTLLLAVFKFDRMEWAIEKCTELNVTTIVPVIARRTEKHLALAAEKRVERWRRIAREASEQSRRTSPPEITEPMKLKDLLTFEDEREEIPVGPGARMHGPWKNEPRRGGDSGSRKEGLQERPANEPRSGGTEVSPGREPWVDMATGQSRVATAQADENNIRIVLAENERDLTLTDILSANPNPQALTLAVGPEGGWTPEELKLFAESHWLFASLGETILRAETAAIAALAIARAEV